MDEVYESDDQKEQVKSVLTVDQVDSKWIRSQLITEVPKEDLKGCVN